MAQRKPKRSASHIALSSRQWAWEFLRFNAEYRNAYAAWMAIPESVRNFEAVSSVGVPLGDCPPETQMSYFDVSPSALSGETVAEWLSRTQNERKSGWGVQASSQLAPPDEFLISEWIDPNVTPLPKDKEHIWDNFEVESVGGLVEGRHARAAALLRPLEDIHELAVIVDVRMSKSRLEQEFKNAILNYRDRVRSKNTALELAVYDGKSGINYGGIYEKYVTILQRLDKGETEDDVRRKETPDGLKLPSGSAYIDNMKTQIPNAIALRDGGYKSVAYRDDFVGNLKAKATTGKT